MDKKGVFVLRTVRENILLFEEIYSLNFKKIAQWQGRCITNK